MQYEIKKKGVEMGWWLTRRMESVSHDYIWRYLRLSYVNGELVATMLENKNVLLI